jgi:hypothetical protein
VLTLASGRYSRFYVDGELMDEQIIPLWKNTAPLRIGKGQDLGTKAFEGVLDDVRFYSRAVSKKEVDKLHRFL